MIENSYLWDKILTYNDESVSTVRSGQNMCVCVCACALFCVVMDTKIDDVVLDE